MSEVQYPRVIGIVGPLGAGKTALSRHLISVHGYTPVSMAKPIKDMLMCLGFSKEEVNGSQELRAKPSALLCGKSIRWALQTLGTQWGRLLIGPDVWVNAVQAAVVRHQVWVASTRSASRPPHPGIVIDDIRFPNEAAMVKRLGGVLVRVRRTSAEKPLSPFDRLYHYSSTPAFVALGVKHIATLFGRPVTHESEYHWRFMTSDLDILNDSDIEDMFGAADTFLKA